MKIMRNCLVLSLLVALLLLTSAAGSEQSTQGQQQQSAQKGSDLTADGDKAQNKRGAPGIPSTIVGTPQHAYINQPVVASVAATATGPIGAGASAIGPVAYTSYGHPHYQQHQAGAISSSSSSSTNGFNAGGHHLVQSPAAVAPSQAVYHKINYVSPNAALKVATFAAPAHYEYAATDPALSKYNYAAAIPQYQYAHYPQQTFQLFQHHQQAPAGATIITNAAIHPYSQHHQQATIYAGHQPTAVHYTLTQPAVQHNYPHQSDGQTQAQAGTIHYQQHQHPQHAFVGVQPSVPVVHQAPIAAINQVHQANQVIATQAQLAKYPVPTAVAPIYATNSQLQNQLYHQQTANYGDPDTLTNFDSNTPEAPRTNGGKYGNRKTNVKPIVEYEYDRDEDQPEETEEPCEDEFKPDRKQSSLNRNLYNLWRTYGVATALLKASNQQQAKEDALKKQKKTDDANNGDRIQLIHPPSEGDTKPKPTKGKSYDRKYHYHYDYDHDHDHYHHYDHFDSGKKYGKHSYRRNLE